ncbi:hypothetical protein [Fimbriiglobus ruber]|uniref:hypothetical protein n=1 Tax=Fimbriiglobus ruber TaxID=1908690 RepID=UPI00117B5A65|nr:hypothetical protein [Fimbriiglobus ruber]
MKKGPIFGGAEPTPSPLLFVGEDWTDFRQLDRITVKAGVAKDLLPRVAVKELVDNALDAADAAGQAGAVEYGRLDADDDAFGFFVADHGPGIPGTNAELAVHFSIRRPLTTSKMKLMPSRGKLGNGIRVAVGVALLGNGDVRVSTHGCTLTLVPQADDGTTRVAADDPWDGTGTRIEVRFGDPVAAIARADRDLFRWADVATRLLNRGTRYKGLSSPFWYNPGTFFELLQAAGETPLARVIETLGGCTSDRRVAAITAGFRDRTARAVTRPEAAVLLDRCRHDQDPVPPHRRGGVKKMPGVYDGYGKRTVLLDDDGREVPYVIEAWAHKQATPALTVCVNRTPIVTRVHARRDGTEYALFGAGLSHGVRAGRKKFGEYRILVNVLSPHLPLTSTGKEPDLDPVVAGIGGAVAQAIRGARRAAPGAGAGAHTQKEVIRDHIPAEAARLSGGGAYQFSLRQLFYAIRPTLIDAIGQEPEYGRFSKVVGEYEDAVGAIPHMYRDNRGSIYHPHVGPAAGTIPLGSRTVAEYTRPAWRFDKILYCEKEGLFPVLQHARWPEQYDCTLLTAKGFASRAVRDLVTRLKGGAEPVTVYCIHDADGPGTVIYESLKDKLAAPGVEVVNLGLDPAEGRAMGLTVEPVKRKASARGTEPRVAVARYLSDDDQDWLQTHRIELNAMTSPEFIAWLSRKMAPYHTGKVVPPVPVLTAELEKVARAGLAAHFTAETLRRARIADRVEAAVAAHRGHLDGVSAGADAAVRAALAVAPTTHWAGAVKDQADIAVRGILGDLGGGSRRPRKGSGRKI